MADLTGALLQPDNTVALRAIDPGARAATFRVLFGTGANNTICTLDNLPPSQRFGAIGSIFIDNTANLAPLVISFPDTGAADIIPPGSSSWMLAITGSNRFALSSSCAVATPILVQALNVVVPPTGVQAVSGISLSVAAVVQVSNALQLAAGAADIGTVHLSGPTQLAAGAADIGTVHLGASPGVSIGSIERLTHQAVSGPSSVISNGGTPVVVWSGAVARMLRIVNPLTAVDQNIATAEALIVNPIGVPSLLGYGDNESIPPGGSWQTPDGGIVGTVTVRCNAATSGHRFTVVGWN